MSAVSDTVRAIGPAVSRVGTSGNTPSSGISPHSDFKPHRAAARGRDADRAARVGTQREVAEAGGERGAAAAGRAARRLAGLGGVVAGAVPLVLADHAPRELGQMGLADDDGACVDQPLHGGSGSLGDVVRVDLRAVRRADAGRVEQVLHGQRAARERAGLRLCGLDARDERVPVVSCAQHRDGLDLDLRARAPPAC